MLVKLFLYYGISRYQSTDGLLPSFSTVSFRQSAVSFTVSSGLQQIGFHTVRTS